MKCPYLVKTIIQTNNNKSYVESTRTEHQEFDNCMEHHCPFYSKRMVRDETGTFTIPVCTRVEIEKTKHLPIK